MLGDTNFDENINIQDVILIINFILNNSTPEGDEVIAADFNVDGIINILDVIQVVQQILGTTFAESVEWLEENFPELNTKERLSKLNKEQFFSKRKNCKELEKEYKKLLKENKNLKAKIKLLEKIDREKMLMLKNLKETNDKLRIK
jgi:predicted RNase H-like nuclease (RuvC/YqgF family)